MPKVGKHLMRINGVYRDFEIYYNSKTGFKMEGIPDEVWLFHPEERQPYSETEAMCLRQAEIAISNYHDHVKTRKKVIFVDLQLGNDFIYHFDGQAWNTGKPLHGITIEMANKIKSADGFYKLPQRGQSFSYEIVYMIEREKKEYYKILPDESVGGRCHFDKSPDKSLYIDYTPEAEQFMANTMATFEMLAKKLIEFFTTENLQLKIESASGKFLSNG